MKNHCTTIGALIAAATGLAACADAPTSIPALRAPRMAVTNPAASLYASGVTNPAGTLRLGADLWVSDHALGFCRLATDAAGAVAIDAASCVTAASSPGQATYDAATNFVYIPDNATAGKGVWRLKFDGVRTVGGAVLLAGGAQTSGNRATATALGPDGNLYVGLIRNGNIIRITNPAGASQSASTVAKTSDGRGVSGVAFAGEDLYVAEKGAVRVIAKARSCTGSCTTAATPITSVAPMALTSDQSNVLFIAESRVSTTDIIRFTISTPDCPAGGIEDVYVSGFENLSGIAIDGLGGLIVGDDPSGGAVAGQGHLYQVAPTAPEKAGACAAPAPPPPPPAALTTGALAVSGITSPRGTVILGSDIWTSDHVLGFCRLDATVGGLQINTATCNTAAGSPGQAAFDPATNSVFVPDNSTQSIGVWQLAFDPATRTVSTVRVLSGGGLSANKATAVALADGALYVVFLKNGNVIRVTNPLGSPSYATVGRSSDGRPLNALAFVGADLYLAEASGVGKIASATSCTIGCVAVRAPINATSPTALAFNGTSLFVDDTPFTNSIIRRVAVTGDGSDVVLAHTGVFADGTTSRFQNVSGLSFDQAGNLLVGDDPAAGGTPGQGRLWRVAP